MFAILFFPPVKVNALSDGKQEQNSRVVVTILIANADIATLPHGDTHLACLFEDFLET